MITRNCSPIITFVFEAIFQEAMPMTPPALVALLVMTSGVVLYTYNDVTLTGTGLFACFVDIFVGIIAALLQRRYIALYPVNISFGGMVLLQNVIGVLPDIALVFAIGEPRKWDNLQGHPAGDYLMFALSCVLGLTMGWASINAQQYVTATTMMVMGNANRILIILGGAIFVGEQYTWLGIFGIILAISGSIWYGYTRTRVVYGQSRMRFLSVADGLNKLGDTSSNSNSAPGSNPSDVASNPSDGSRAGDLGDAASDSGTSEPEVRVVPPESSGVAPRS